MNTKKLLHWISTGKTRASQPRPLRQRFCAAFLLSVGLLAVSSRAQFIWTTNTDGTITITGHTGFETSVTIPSTINGRTVTAIGRASFSPSDLSDTNLTSVLIPNSVVVIGDS